MRARALAAAAVLAACAAAYLPVLDAGFVYDDHIYVENNPFVRDPGNLRVMLDWRFYARDQGLFAGSRPVFLASLLADRAAWGALPAGYHLTNLLLHASNALCVTALGAGLGLGLFGGALAGVLFAVQPLLSEAVCGVSFRPDLLAALFAFGAVLLLRGAWTTQRRGGFLVRAGWAAGLFLLSLMAKESAALIPLTAFIPWRDEPAPTRRRAAAALLMLASAGLLYAAFRAPRFHYELGVEAPQAARAEDPASLAPETANRRYPPSPPPWRELYSDPWTRTWTMSAETGASLRRLAWPGRPTVERAPFLRRSWLDPAVLASWLLFAAVAALAFSRRRAAPGAAWVLAALAPVCGLVPLYNPTADRYLYLPMAGAAWVLAAGILALAERAVERRREAALTLTALLALPWALSARRRTAEWSSDKTLFSAATPAAQGPRVPYNLAIIHIEEGRAGEAAAELGEAVRRHPGFTEAWSKLGALHEALGNVDLARAAFARGAAEAVPSPLPAFAFARFLERRGELSAAEAVYLSALARDPAFEPARAALTRQSPKR